MARIRTVKPEHWQDPRTRALSRDARLTDIGMNNLYDDEGRMRYDPRIIRTQIHPSDDDITDEILVTHLEELQSVGKIVVYSINGDTYIQKNGWTDEQRINRPSPSRIPPPPEPKGAFNDDSLNPHGGFDEGSSPERKGKEGKGEEGSDPPEESGEESEDATKVKTGEMDQEIEESPPPSSPKFGEDYPAYKVACHLRSRLFEWRPTLDLPPATQKTLAGWTTEIDRAIRRNKRDPEELIVLIDWMHDEELPGNNGFRWRDVVRSGKKLREKYDDIELSRTRQEESRQVGNTQPGLETKEGKNKW